MARRKAPYRPNDLEFPLTATQVDGLNATVDDIYSRLVQANTQSLPLSPPAVDGDLIVLIDGVWSRLPIGTAGEVLTVVSGLPDWESPNHDILSARHSDVTVAAAVNGDLLIRDTTWKRLAIGAAGDRLKVSGGLPAWGAEGTWEVLSNGDADNPEVMFDSNGEVMMTYTP